MKTTPSSQSKPFGILFVCLGNICRSPIAEGVFREHARRLGVEAKFFIDSSGTGAWHVGEAPHKESQNTTAQHGISIAHQRARQLSPDDIERFDLFIAMDRENQRDILELFDAPDRVRCIREFDEQAESLDVPDPYYGGKAGFAEVYSILDRSCEALLQYVMHDYLE